MFHSLNLLSVVSLTIQYWYFIAHYSPRFLSLAAATAVVQDNEYSRGLEADRQRQEEQEQKRLAKVTRRYHHLLLL